MFRRSVESAASPVTLAVDGREVHARSGESVAAALLAAGISAFRRAAVSAAPRGPWCLMGACFECLVTIEGVRQRACMVRVEEGMRIEIGEARRKVTP
jgi:D-hydroxyproline dehydrogenase subunit gamma